MDVSYISAFDIVKLDFLNHHTAGTLQNFETPCIGYIIKGEAEFLYQGRTINAKERDLIYIARGTKYYSVWTGHPEIEFYSMRFRFLNASAQNEFHFQILRNFNRSGLDEIYKKKDGSPMEALGLFYVFLEMLYKNLKKEVLPAELDEIKPAIAFLESNYRKKIYVKDLASMCCFSESRFYTLFKAATGCTPIDYKNNLLIQHSMALLAETNKPIEQISDELGFSSVSYFRKLFKAVTGKNPKDVRK